MHKNNMSKTFIFKIFTFPIKICKYFYIGFKTVFIYDCLFIYSIFKYIFIGIKKLIKFIIKIDKESKEKKKQNQNAFTINEFNKLRSFKSKKIKIIKEKIEDDKKAELKAVKKEETSSKKKKKEEAYINEKVEAPNTFNTRLSDFVKGFSGLHNKIINKFKNNEFTRHNKNQEMMKREALLINFDGKDAEKSENKVLYEYVAKNKEGKIVKDYFEAYSKVEVHSFLLSEGYEVYSIKTNKWIQLLHKSKENKVKFKTNDLIFFITQLSTYIKAGIPLVEGLKILERQYKNKKYKKILTSIIYDLTMGENFSEALLKQNVAFPRLLINMVKTAEMTGELPEVLDDQAEYYTQTEKIRKSMISAMIYPTIVFMASIGVAVFIMLYVVPKFVDIYNTLDASQIPGITLAVLAISEFLKKYLFVLLGGIIAIIILSIVLYKTNKTFRTLCQLFVMKLPIIGNTIIYNEVSMFTKTFSSLLAHNVFITDSMDVLNKMTNNEIYRMIILDTISNLAKGDKISEAFKDHWAFPIPAYEMLVTGEKTGELPEMMQKVSAYYQELHADNVNKIKTIAEPAITIFLTVIVGFLILAIIIPMFNMYQVVQTM